MEQIEDTLKSYRVRKRRQEKISQVKKCVKELFMIAMKNEEEQTDRRTLALHESKEKLQPSSHVTDEPTDDKNMPVEDDTIPTAVGNAEDIPFKYILRFVCLAFWITLFIIAIELQFGIVFLIFSALIGIYLNTRTGPKQHNEISAYSVFNKSCESIDGTLKAEQFEREIGLR